MVSNDDAFVANVSHELRTPLTTIQMAAEVLYDSRSEFSGDVRRAAELLYTEVERFELLLADLLEMSQFDAGAAFLVNDAIDIGLVVAKVVAELRSAPASAAAEISVFGAGDGLVVEADRVRLERVLRNLLVNALSHGGGGQVAVHIRATAPGEAIADHGAGPGRAPVTPLAGVLVEVVDSGPGLPPDSRRVFDRFWRADPARGRDTGGVGLGLAIAAEDVALHHGLIRAASNPHGGSTFRVWLPTTRPTLPTDPL